MKPCLASDRSVEPHGRGLPLTLLAIVGTLLVVAASLAACSSSNPSASGPLATYHAENARTGYSTDSGITTANGGRPDRTVEP